MHHHMPPSKTWWSSLNVVIFPPVMRLVLDDPNSDHPDFFYQIHELILEGSRISAKSIAEHLSISRGRVGFITHEDLNMGKLSAKWAPKFLNTGQKRQWCNSCEQLLQFFRHDPNDFLWGAIGDHGRNLVISLWPGDKATVNGMTA